MGREDGPSRTSEPLILALSTRKRIEGEVRAFPLLDRYLRPSRSSDLWRPRRGSRGGGGRVAGVRTPVCYQGPGRPDRGVRRSRFEGSTDPLSTPNKTRLTHVA